MSSLLLAPSSNGGNIARDGFEYQDSYILLNLGRWVSSNGFLELFNENLGDIEVGYLTTNGVRRVCYEAKNHTLSPAEVWEEMDQFKEIFDKSNGLYSSFVLVMPDMPATLSALKSMLDILCQKGRNFAADSTIFIDARSDLISWIKKKGVADAQAEFIADFVTIDLFNLSNAEQEFSGSVTTALPCLLDVTGRELQEIRIAWKGLIERSVKGAVSRLMVEESLIAALGRFGDIWRHHPTEILIKTGPSTVTTGDFDLFFDLTPFTDDSRHGRTDVEWQEVISGMDTIGGFIRTSRPRNKLIVNAELRMSAAVATGHAFRAVKGHVLHMRHRDSLYAISDLISAPTSFFDCLEYGEPGPASNGVVGIQVGLALRPHLDQACVQHGLESTPRLMIATENPINDNTHLNNLVDEAKRALARFKAERNLSRIHVFVKAPSFFAMAFGHRLNGLGAIQLYDWAGSDYRPTLMLDTSR